MADNFADSIMDQVHSLGVDQLLMLCGQFKVVVPEDKKDKRGAVVRLLTKFVNEKLEADAEDELGQLDGEIGKLLKAKVKADKGLKGLSASVMEGDKDISKDAGGTGSKNGEDGAKSSVDGDLARQKVELLRGMRA